MGCNTSKFSPSSPPPSSLVVSADHNPADHISKLKYALAPVLQEIRSRRDGKHEFKVLAVGDVNVGKTSLLLRYCTGKFQEDESKTTIVDILTKTHGTVTLRFWDTAGQEKNKTLTKSFFNRAVAALICYDVTSRESFENVRDWNGQVTYNVADGLFVILLGLKSDLGDLRQVRTDEGKALQAQIGALAFYEVSSKNNEGVEVAMNHLLKQVIEVQTQ